MGTHWVYCVYFCLVIDVSRCMLWVYSFSETWLLLSTSCRRSLNYALTHALMIVLVGIGVHIVMGHIFRWVTPWKILVFIVRSFNWRINWHLLNIYSFCPLVSQSLISLVILSVRLTRVHYYSHIHILLKLPYIYWCSHPLKLSYLYNSSCFPLSYFEYINILKIYFDMEWVKK